MSGNPEFDKSMKDLLGDAVEYLKCSECNADLIICKHCKEATCPNECK